MPKNIDLKTVWVVLTKDYFHENGVRVVQICSTKARANRWCGEDTTLSNHYWYEEAEFKDV